MSSNPTPKGNDMLLVAVLTKTDFNNLLTQLVGTTSSNRVSLNNPQRRKRRTPQTMGNGNALIYMQRSTVTERLLNKHINEERE
jgi:hypothetical protein